MMVLLLKFIQGSLERPIIIFLRPKGVQSYAVSKVSTHTGCFIIERAIVKEHDICAILRYKIHVNIGTLLFYFFIYRALNILYKEIESYVVNFYHRNIFFSFKGAVNMSIHLASICVASKHLHQLDKVKKCKETER